MSVEQSKEDLLRRLEEVQRRSTDRHNPRWKYFSEPEAHLAADIALLKYIGDREITEAFMRVHKWYS